MTTDNTNTPRRAEGTGPALVGGFVFLAYYWTGFTDDPATMLDACDSRRTANAVLREHKRRRNAELEYDHRANWWVRRQAVRTANNALHVQPGREAGGL